MSHCGESFDESLFLFSKLSSAFQFFFALLLVNIIGFIKRVTKWRFYWRNSLLQHFPVSTLSTLFHSVRNSAIKRKAPSTTRSDETCAMKLFPVMKLVCSAFVINLFQWNFLHIALYYRVHFHIRLKTFSFTSFFIFLVCSRFVWNSRFFLRLPFVCRPKLRKSRKYHVVTF